MPAAASWSFRSLLLTQSIMAGTAAGVCSGNKRTTCSAAQPHRRLSVLEQGRQGVQHAGLLPGLDLNQGLGRIEARVEVLVAQSVLQGRQRFAQVFPIDADQVQGGAGAQGHQGILEGRLQQRRRLGRPGVQVIQHDPADHDRQRMLVVGQLEEPRHGVLAGNTHLADLTEYKDTGPVPLVGKLAGQGGHGLLAVLLIDLEKGDGGPGPQPGVLVRQQSPQRRYRLAPPAPNCPSSRAASMRSSILSLPSLSSNRAISGVTGLAGSAATMTPEANSIPSNEQARGMAALPLRQRLACDSVITITGTRAQGQMEAGPVPGENLLASPRPLPYRGRKAGGNNMLVRRTSPWCLLPLLPFLAPTLAAEDKAAAPVPPVKPASSVTAPQVRPAGAGLAYLEKGGLAWMNEGKCIACHHGEFLLWSHNEARLHGFAVDPKKLTAWTAKAVDLFLSTREKECLAKKIGGVEATNLLLGQVTLPGDEHARELQRVSALLLNAQQGNGSWKYEGQSQKRADAEANEATTLWAVLALTFVEKPMLPIRRRARPAGSRRDRQRRQRTGRPAAGDREGIWRTGTGKRTARRADQTAERGWQLELEQGIPGGCLRHGPEPVRPGPIRLKDDNPAVQRPRKFLLEKQRPDGWWHAPTKKA